MKSPFRNGHRFQIAIRHAFPRDSRRPLVTVGMAGISGDLVPVTGKIDTGSFCTILTAGMAAELGIDNPANSRFPPRSAWTAAGERLAYRLHPVWVNVGDDGNQNIEFPLYVGVSGDIRGNLFGMDWLAHLCMAIDSEAVHFLRD